MGRCPPSAACSIALPVEVLELRPGLWRWTAPTRTGPADGGPEGWEADVGCVYYEAPTRSSSSTPSCRGRRRGRFLGGARPRRRASRPARARLLTISWHKAQRRRGRRALRSGTSGRTTSVSPIFRVTSAARRHALRRDDVCIPGEHRANPSRGVSSAGPLRLCRRAGSTAARTPSWRRRCGRCSSSRSTSCSSRTASRPGEGKLRSRRGSIRRRILATGGRGRRSRSTSPSRPTPRPRCAPRAWPNRTVGMPRAVRRSPPSRDANRSSPPESRRSSPAISARVGLERIARRTRRRRARHVAGADAISRSTSATRSPGIVRRSAWSRQRSGIARVLLPALDDRRCAPSPCRRRRWAAPAWARGRLLERTRRGPSVRCSTPRCGREPWCRRALGRDLERHEALVRDRTRIRSARSRSRVGPPSVRTGLGRSSRAPRPRRP